MSDTHEDLYPLICRVKTVLSEMVTELRLRGCKDANQPISDAMALIPCLEAMENRLGVNATKKPVDSVSPVPVKLHQLTVEKVHQMDLSDFEKQDLPPHTKQDLAEAAFTFENELLTVLGDDNAMPWESYLELSRAQLIQIIQSSVENICRVQSGR